MDNRNNMEYKSRELYSLNRCNKRRQYKNVSTQSIRKTNYDKIILIKNVIKEALEKEDMTLEEIERKIEEEFEYLEYSNNKTKYLTCELVKKMVTRYIEYERGLGRKVIFPEHKQIDIFGIKVDVSVDACFIDDDCIEVVKFKAKRPNITQGGSRLDYTISGNLEIYAMLKYCEELAKTYPKQEIKASFYFLRKTRNVVKGIGIDNDDDDYFYINDNMIRDKNIVSLSYDIDDTLLKRNYDEHYEKKYKDFILGENDCTDCEYCDFYNICNYKQAPLKSTEKKEHKKASAIKLTPSQKRAVNAEEGIFRINAGAGAGKTMVVALRTAMLLLKGLKPEEMCLLTFTDAGAEEMRERIKMYCEDLQLEINLNKMIIGTFNSFGYNIVKKNYKILGFTKEPEVIDDIDKKEIILKIIDEEPVMIEEYDYLNIDMKISNCKGALETIIRAFEIIKNYNLSQNKDDYKKFISKMLSSKLKACSYENYEVILNMYAKYIKELKKKNLIEYADQEVLLFKLIEENPLMFYKFGIKYLIVDEFQDTSEIQLEIVKHLIDNPVFESLMVVGDDSQSIYEFRDTTPDNIINFFDKINRKGTDIYLVDNFRSTPEIIYLANEVNKLNKNRIPKDLIANKEHGKNTIIKGFKNIKLEHSWIVNEVCKKIQAGEKPERISIIARTRLELLEIGELLTGRGIPWTLLNPEPILENSRVIAAIELAKLYKQSDSSQSALVYLNCLYNNKLLDKTEEEINELILNFQELIKENIEDKDFFFSMLEKINENEDEIYSSFIEKLKNKGEIEEIINYAIKYEEYGKDQTVKRQHSYPGVVLVTAHSSKGLEFPIVYNSISKYYDKTPVFNIEEARRLLFVSITRAQDELYVTGRYYLTKEITNNFLKDLYEIKRLRFPTRDELDEIDDL